MKFIAFYQVDARTKISLAEDIARTGPMYPNIKGLDIIFTLESEYPTHTPLFYGTCDDSADTSISGVKEILTFEGFNEAYQAELLKQKTILKNKVEDLRLQKIYSDNIPYVFPGDTEPDGIQLRDNGVDRPNLQDFLANCISLEPDATVFFRPISNTPKVLTASEGQVLGKYLFDRGASIMQASWEIKTEIDNVTTFEALKEINIYVGWPIIE